ncbi:MAG: RIP metalloprotease RseP [SAR324 cluster bacterium]|nr:RIP metalloprotease RseP [SAR324 cluster bacterium]
MLLTIVSFLIVLTILVFVHESGHALAARHVGVKVQQFSIGFPPRIFGKTIGETEFVFSWIPLGGYVKLFGQNIDDEDPSDPRNYASKTILQRFYILVAGPVANLLLALALMPVVFMLGVETPAYRYGPAHIVGTVAGSPAEQAGFQPGDRIVAVGEAQTASWIMVFNEAAKQALAEDTVIFHTERGGRNVSVAVPSKPISRGKSLGWKPLIPPVVGGFVASDFPAWMAGLESGDLITAVDGEPVTRWSQISRFIQKGEGREMLFSLRRGNQSLSLPITPRYNEDSQSWLIGISLASTKIRHGLFESVRKGTARLWEITSTTFLFLGKLLTGQGSMDALGGPVKIGVVVGEAVKSGAANLIFLMAFISLQLGIFNLLPIPALDGGHIFMLGLEKLKGRPLSPAVRERAQMIGFSLLILLILIVTYNDIVQLIT